MEDKSKMLTKVIIISIVIFIVLAGFLSYLGMKAANEYEKEEAQKAAKEASLVISGIVNPV